MVNAPPSSAPVPEPATLMGKSSGAAPAGVRSFGDAKQNVSLQVTAFRNPGVDKGGFWAGHANALHDCARTYVCDCRGGHDLLELQGRETVVKYLRCRF